MKRIAALLLCSLSLAAYAQHVHDDAPPPKVVGKKVDKTRGVPVLVAPKPGETVDHAAAHALTVGNGAPASSIDGAWLVPPVSGVYTLPQTSLVEGKRVPVFMAQAKAGPVELIAGRPYRLWPWKGPLVWTPPGGKQGKVPAENLLPVAPSTVDKTLPKLPRR